MYYASIGINLKYWRGVLSIIMATMAPFAAYVNGDTTIKGAVVLSAISGVTALYNLIDQTISEQAALRTVKRSLREAKAKSISKDDPTTAPSFVVPQPLASFEQEI